MPGKVRHTSLTIMEIVLLGTLQANCISLYLDPDARCRSVMASFIPGSSGALQNVCCLAILGPTRSKISSNISVGMRKKFINDLWSSLLSAIINWSYRPNSKRLSGLSHALDHHLRCLRRLRLFCVYVMIWRLASRISTSACSNAARYRNPALVLHAMCSRRNARKW